MELHTYSTKSCSTTKSMENLQAASSPSASAPGISQLLPLRLPYMQGSVSQSGETLVWKGVIWDLCPSPKNMVFQDTKIFKISIMLI